ncbi:MAG TPA: hypothetical protein VMW50_03390 [Dehalococcoidia bacterium]|nr:hypothetical protein [Dehalococcoidia bacterium]
MKILEDGFYALTILIILILMTISHVEQDKRLDILEQSRLEQVEKEKLVVGYWTWNPQYCQYFYGAKDE